MSEENKVIRFPGTAPVEEEPQKSEEEIRTERIKECSEHNKMYITAITQSVKLESEQFRYMVQRDGHETSHIEDDLADIAMLMLESARNRIEKSFGGLGRVDAVLSMYMNYLNGIYSGNILTPLYGTDNEWEDVTNPEDVEKGREMVIRVNGNRIVIPFKKLEVNKRIRTVFRLNGDNRLAHRTDMVVFVDPQKPNEPHLDDESVRFITFPYNGEVLTCNATFKDGRVEKYLSCTEDYIKNAIVYPAPDADMHNPDTYDHYAIYPKVPEHLFAEAGIDKDREIEKYLMDVQAEYEALQEQMRRAFETPISDSGEEPVNPEVDGACDPDAGSPMDDGEDY